MVCVFSSAQRVPGSRERRDGERKEPDQVREEEPHRQRWFQLFML